jgi:RNA polymerase sigma-70 factor (ECF subfamily)
MSISFQGAIEQAALLLPAIGTQKARYCEIYSEHCHRIYSLAFWMTDHELLAEQLAANTFLRAFARSSNPEREQIDQAFLAEVRELTPVGTLSLGNKCSLNTEAVRGNMKRIHLERAVVELPATEKLIFLLHDVEGYEHQRIAGLLGITEDESRLGLHQARVQIRELVAKMRQ